MKQGNLSPYKKEKNKTETINPYIEDTRPKNLRN